MREAWIVARRELGSYFTSPIAYVFGALFLGVQLFIGTAGMRHGEPANIATFFTWLPIVFLLFLPALTMRLWSEERKLGTLELLMTYPVRIPELIAGKFVAAMIFLAALLVLTISLPITLDVYGSIDWGPVFGAYLATMLMAASYIAVGMFWSSLTSDQIVAMLLSLVTLAILFALGWPVFLVWLSMVGMPEWCIGLLAAISPFKYFLSIARGVLDTRDLVYYALFCVFFLNANALVLKVRRATG